MPELHTLALFLSAGLALNLTPGPDMLYVATRAAGEGRVAGLVSALGIAAGCLVHIAVVAFGLSALLQAVPTLYHALRWAGALYLIYLGGRMLLRPRGLLVAGSIATQPLGAIFRDGALTNVLNPKVALFFLAFLPQFVDPARGHAAGQIIILGLLFNTTGTLVNAGVALLTSGATGWLHRSEQVATRAQRGAGAVLVALGARLAWTGRTSG
jgi:threonine/homoserine/homoserine lactone efflux protein